jgi:hypothetical protein
MLGSRKRFAPTSVTKRSVPAVGSGALKQIRFFGPWRGRGRRRYAGAGRPRTRVETDRPNAREGQINALIKYHVRGLNPATLQWHTDRKA